eukprot:SAG31_NODE_5578_length_2447_cov_1.292589_3_plen_98_part_00
MPVRLPDETFEQRGAALPLNKLVGGPEQQRTAADTAPATRAAVALHSLLLPTRVAADHAWRRSCCCRCRRRRSNEQPTCRMLERIWRAGGRAGGRLG